MTISNQASSIIYTGNGVQVTWNYNFLIPYQDDGVTPAVTVKTNLFGVETTLVLGVDYVITAVGNPAGGTIVFTTAPDSNTTFIIYRNLDYVQGYAVPNQSFLPNTVEQLGDTITGQIQQLHDVLNNTFRFSRTQGNSAGITETPAERANLYLGFDSGGNLTTRSLDLSMIVAELALLEQSLAVNVFNYIPADLIPNIIARTSTTDVSSYLNAAHLAAGPNGKVFYPTGTYICQQILYLNGQDIQGYGGDSTVLVKPQNSNASILVPYDWFNNNSVNQNPSTIRDLGFAADSTSTGGFAIINMSQRSIIEDNVINGDPAGTFGGVWCTNTTKNQTALPGNNNISGIHFINNHIRTCSSGGVIARYSVIQSIVANVSITLNMGTKGVGGASVYNDPDTGTNFNGTSNGTNVILVANTAGLNVGDRVTGIDTFIDHVSDVYLSMNVISNCGNASVASVHSAYMNGWIIHQNKIETTTGPLVVCGYGSHSLTLNANILDYGPAVGQAGNNVCMLIYIDDEGRDIITGNQFKTLRITDLTKTYTILQIVDEVGDLVPAEANICANNSFSMPAAPTNFTAFKIVNPALTLGYARNNGYYSIMTAAQRGNGDSVWAPVLAPGTPPATPAIGWTEPYVDVADGKLKAKASTGTVVILGTP